MEHAVDGNLASNGKTKIIDYKNILAGYLFEGLSKINDTDSDL